MENLVENENVSTSTGGAANVTTEITEIHPDDLTIRNVVSPGTPNAYPTAVCRIARSGGLSLPGASLSAGSSVEDVECTLRETARSFNELGAPEMGIYLLCTQSQVINGRYDRKGELEEGIPDPIGATECLRLVRDLAGDTNGSTVQTSVRDELQEEVEILRAELYAYRDEQQLEQQALEEEVRIVASEQNNIIEIRDTPAPEQHFPEPFLNESKRSALLGLLEEE